MLPIRQALSSLKKFPAGPKAALIEVCELYENGGKESCWITNNGLAERLGSHAVTVSRNLLWLYETGLLDVRHRPDLGNRRELVPTMATRSVYGPEQNSEAAQALLAKRYGSKQTAKSTPLSETLRPSYQNAKTLLAKRQGGLSETAKSCLRAMTSNDEQESGAAVAASPALAVVGLVEWSNSELAPDEPTAWASHTRGGGPAPANMEADELPSRPVAVDQSQPDDEYHRWIARPRDAAMVDEYLTRIKHPKAGKGHLFFDWYEPLGWVIGRNRMPCQNWKALIKSFKFLESNASASTRNRSTGSNDARGRLNLPANLSFENDEA
ncbi:hypothetical protein [Hymenobacter pini]|uniref:hypothetical protein n=1 Tax=Hymenobacter pini TaxID=2880879 RepID=UPI001CF3866B|nr:hypothetical protein [Hymenobacter pini]MCA8829411.1 hypothetical protein [Hymenobacter pini]